MAWADDWGAGLCLSWRRRSVVGHGLGRRHRREIGGPLKLAAARVDVAEVDSEAGGAQKRYQA